ncbi:Cleavage/polyadenylation specificity factor, A subunit, C-terminal [Trema orientale]|uniref:Cleavage/polyadenylation specificity factor, A subunit, C-terminal n=1 Tax=Trema orientale TaxID=63057 RepID=A0A2P5EA56_TREOI|nr:Cleavage/polyadenylation specificity factor, A subunit, C-terminal [Trema orientale]
MALSEEECSSAKSRSSSSAAASSSSSGSSSSTHYLAKCVLRGSVVLHVVYGRIRSPTSLDVVFGKETSIELVIIGEDGIVQSVSEQPVFGTIKDLAILPWKDKFSPRNPQMLGRDYLLVLSDSGKLSILSFCNEMHRFFPETQVQLSPPGNLRDQLGRLLAVDSSGSFIAASAYENQLAMFSVSVSAGSDIIDKKILYPPENEGDVSTARSIQKNSISGTIWGMCFISKDPCRPSKGQNPVLAILLNRRRALLNELLLLEWNIRDHAVSVLSQYVKDGPLAYDIVEVPHSYGFAIVFRVGDALLMDLRDAHKPCCVYRTNLNFLPHAVEEQNFVEESSRVQHDVDDEGLFNVAACALLELRDYDPMCIDGDNGNVNISYKHACSWSWEPGNAKNPRMIFCLDTGEFFLIQLGFDSGGLKVSQSDCLYKGLPCKALLWVEGGFIAALVEMGDGMVLKLEDEKLIYGSPIQNIAPVLDMSIVDYHDEKHDQIFACCGVMPEGSLRIIQSGISVEKLLRTAPIYQGITGTWTVRMKVTDSYHSFLVLSFVEETRVLSVGLSFTDVTDSVGFQPDVCTLACGLLNDGLLVQIHQHSVRLCLPTKVAHSEGISLPSPVCMSWFPDNMSINLGAIGENLIVVSTSNPCLLFILGVRMLSAYNYEIYEMQHLRLQYELSCISIPQKIFEQKSTNHPMDVADESCLASLSSEVDVSKSFVVGTHKPSVEVLVFDPDEGLRHIAIGTIALTNIMGTAVSGCVPQDVRLVFVDRFYVLSGLRNGMLLRFEWPAVSTFPSSVLPSSSVSVDEDPVLSSISAPNSFGLQNNIVKFSGKTKSRVPIDLQLIAIRRIGITPVFLIPLSGSLDADIIALSDRPWLLHAARHSLSYTSISFQSSTHVTPVCSVECPKGLLFVAENSLHLVEMVHSKRLNVQKFNLGGTPRKVLYHSESRLLLVMRTELTNDTCSSDICCVDPLSGTVLSCFKLEHGETGKSMELVRVGNEQVLVVGTSLSSGPAIMPSGEAESTKGRLLVLCLEHAQNSDSGSMTFCSKAGSYSQRASPFREVVGYATEQLSSSSLCSSPDDSSCDGIKLEETEAWQLRLAYSATWPGMVLAICPYLERYFLASAGNVFYVCGFANDNSQRVRKLAAGRTRFMITSLTAHFTRIAVGDCRDGVLFFLYHEDAKKLEQLYCDPSQRLVADCILMDVDTAVVSDRKGSIAVLSCTDNLEDNASPECNLTVSCAYYMGEIAMSIRKGSFSYRLPADDVLKGGDLKIDSAPNTIIASTLLGSIITFIPLSREEYELLEAVQARLVVHPLTAPVLGNDHNEFRSRENPAGVPKILDGDMLTQFLELTSLQQEAVLSLPLGSKDAVSSSSKLSPPPIPVNQVVQLLERVHYALN